MSDYIPFITVVSVLRSIEEKNTAAEKCEVLRKFITTHCQTCDFFAAVRLIVPTLDRERGSYGLTQSELARFLIGAVGSENSPEALKLINWKENGGNFPLLAKQLIIGSNSLSSSGIIVKELNKQLDILATCKRTEKRNVLSTIIHKTSAEEIKWVIGIIVKDWDDSWLILSNLQEFHPFNFKDETRFFSFAGLEVLSLLRKREVNATLVMKFTAETLATTNTSIELEVRLEKSFETLYSSFVDRVYTVYDEDRRTFDIWVCQSSKPDSTEPYWTGLNTKRMKKVAASNFTDDNKGALVAKVLAVSLQKYIFSGPLQELGLLRIYSVFCERKLENGRYPHLLAVTVAESSSQSLSQAEAWDEKWSNKLKKGYLLTFCKANVLGPLDSRRVSLDGFRIPRFMEERIRGLYEIDGPATRYVMDMVAKICASSTPERRIEVQNSYANDLGKKLDPKEILAAMEICFPWIDALELHLFCAEACSALVGFMEDDLMEEPFNGILEMFEI